MRLLVVLSMFIGGFASSVAWADFFEDVFTGTERPGATLRPPPPSWPDRPGRPERPLPPPYRPDRPDPGRGEWGRGGYGRNLICTSVDKGHEEHWRGHSTCGECLSKHGQCIETCSRVDSFYSCQFEGQNEVGRREVFVGEDEDRRYAEQSAENRCYRAGYRYCRYLGCNSREQQQVVSRQYCRP